MNPEATQAPIFSIISFFSSPQTAGFAAFAVAKLSILFGLGLYFIFCIVVLRQVSLMTRTVSTPLDGTLKMMAWLHMAAAVSVFWIAATVL